jgi:GAF domain-containing protein
MGRAIGDAPCDRAAAIRLASDVTDLTNELEKCRAALRDRDAEFVGQVQSPIRRENSRRFTQRLEAILESSAQALACQAAAVYILDEDTTQLKLRASFGLPVIRLAEEPRELEGATADLEALVGHAVVLEDDKLFGFWRVPEPDYEAAVCVPIASADTILGTFWLFSSEPRDFSERDTDLIEILAGRFAAELERDALLAEMRR